MDKNYYSFRLMGGITRAAILTLVLASVSAVSGQALAGRISGTIIDQAGAAVPNASITITDTATNFSRTATSNDAGFYTVTNLPVGTYNILVEVPGFKKALKSGTSVNADARLTVDFMVETGQITETVEVTASHGETINTTSGELSKVIDNQQISNLALNGRNYYQLLSVIPGAVVTADDALDTNLATNTININGNRGVSNNLTVDGGNNLNAGSNASQINNVGLDFIQEVKLQTSNFSAEYGRNSGAQINVVTRRGTNEYHGSVFEYLRRDRLDSADAFAAVKPSLNYDNYGFSLGGPVQLPNFGIGSPPAFTSMKDKFFFFFGMEWKKIERSGASNRQTVPTLSELNGDFSFRLRGADGIVGTNDDGVLRDPASGLPCTAANRAGCFGGLDVNLRNRIPLNRFTADGQAFSNLYRTMIGLASGYVNSPIAQNATFQPPLTSDFRQEILRLDYIISDNQTLYGRYLHDSNVVFEPYGTFINSPLPTSQQLRNRPGNGLQIAHIWTVSPTLINEGKFSAAWTDQRVVPSTTFADRATYGFNFTQLFPNGGQYEQSIPDVTYAGTGAVANFSGNARALTALARDYTVTDTVTWVQGNHTLKFGGYFNYGQIFQNGRSIYAGQVAFNTGGNPNSTGNAFADSLIGNFRTYTEAAYDPAGHFRFQQYEGFVNDSWRVNRHLSLELGMRWQYGTPFYSAENNITNFDPRLYDPARAVTINNAGTIITIPPGATRFNGLVRAGNGVPSQYQGSVPNFNSPSVLSVPDGAPRGFYDPKNYFMPRVGFAYAPGSEGKTVIRGGFGVYYDRIEGNIIFPLESNPPYVDSQSFDNGNLNNIRGGAASAIGPFGAITTISPDLEASSTMNFSLGVQHEFWKGIFVEVTGVGNLGRHLTRQTDINAVPFATLAANAALPTPLGINAMRQYKGFSAINQRLSDATSHYYALQFYAGKRQGDLLATVSYTWGKVLTDANVLTEAAEEGLVNRHFNYGPATFDRRQVFVGTYTYSVPFFRNRTGFAKAVLDGFEISGITRLQAGRPYTITGATSIGTRRADVTGNNLYIRENRQWLNPAAFATAPNTRLGNSGVGIVTGPILSVTDFSFRKRVRLGESRQLSFQADLFNAFNHNNFSNLNTVITSAGFGAFTVSGPGRSIQLGARFDF